MLKKIFYKKAFLKDEDKHEDNHHFQITRSIHKVEEDIEHIDIYRKMYTVTEQDANKKEEAFRLEEQGREEFQRKWVAHQEELRLKRLAREETERKWAEIRLKEQEQLKVQQEHERKKQNVISQSYDTLNMVNDLVKNDFNQTCIEKLPNVPHSSVRIVVGSDYVSRSNVESRNGVPAPAVLYDAETLEPIVQIFGSGVPDNLKQDMILHLLYEQTKLIRDLQNKYAKLLEMAEFAPGNEPYQEVKKEFTNTAEKEAHENSNQL